MKIPVILHKDYIVHIEEYEDKLFGHIDVYRWNKTVKKSIDNSLQQLFNLYGRDIYALHENTQDNKHRKFLEMLKFKLYSTEMGLDGLTHQVWRKQINTKEII